MRLRARILSRAALLALGVFLALLIGEIAARFPAPTAAPQAARPAPPAGLPVIQIVSHLWEPNVRAIYSGAFYRSNSQGIRGPEYAPEPAPGVFRIVVAGDSITMGAGVAEEDAYPALLERMLNADGSGRRYEVINLGMVGFNIHQVSARLETLGLPLHPDLIVYGCTLNDIEIDAGYRYSSRNQVGVAYQEYQQRFRDSRSALLRTLWPRWVSLREVLLPPPDSYVYELDDNYFHNEHEWLMFAFGLQQFARIQEESGVCVDVFVHTVLSYLNLLHPYRRHYRKIERAAELQHLPVTQSWPQLRGQSAEQLILNPYDTHPNERGHELLARALFEGLHALPPSCWQKRGESAQR